MDCRSFKRWKRPLTLKLCLYIYILYIYNMYIHRERWTRDRSWISTCFPLGEYFNPYPRLGLESGFQGHRFLPHPGLTLDTHFQGYICLLKPRLAHETGFWGIRFLPCPRWQLALSTLKTRIHPYPRSLGSFPYPRSKVAEMERAGCMIPQSPPHPRSTCIPAPLVDQRGERDIWNFVW